MAGIATSEGSSESDALSVPVATFVKGTAKARTEVAVVMSLKIIERFSEGLYSSPNKTFEELVSNSWDAGASAVWTYMPADLKRPDARIVVIDDGVSMDVDGLKDLWKIGESRKRISETRRAGRSPIGKFGIGKLATYVLANELTYVVFRDGVYRAVTMDYNRVRGEMSDPHTLHLEVVELSVAEARSTIETALAGMAIEGSPSCLDAMFKDQAASWTAAIMTRLKDPAHHIQQGRLKWVLSTSLPLNPAFTLYYNDVSIEPSKASGEEVWSYVIGESSQDELPPSAPKGSVEVVEVEGVSQPALRLPNAGLIWGTAVLYRDALARGRSEDRARSHGFFVRVRHRLINLDDPTFDVGPELHHGTFTRFNMVVNADDLDVLVASPRESIQDSPELRELKTYMLALFNKARTVLVAKDEGDTMPLLKGQGRIANPPPGLTQGPLRRTIRRATASPDAMDRTLGLKPENLSAADQLARNNEDLIESVEVESDSYEGRLVRFDPERKAAILNLDHPFVNNYINEKGATEPLKLLGLTELLTEAYMLDEDIEPAVVSRVIARRDLFLRDLVKRHPRSAPLVARHLLEASNSEKELEDAVADALDILGFNVTRVGGSGGTDGIAVARLGQRGADGDRSESYALTYDAKSSGKEAQDVLTLQQKVAEQPTKRRRSGSGAPKIQAGTTRTSILRVHRDKAQEKYNLPFPAEFTLLVAPGFEGDNLDGALIGEICRNDGITPITVEDFSRLVKLFPVRWVSPLVLKQMFQECRSPQETRSFIDKLETGAAPAPSSPPVKMIIELLIEYSERRTPVRRDTVSTAIYERTSGAVDLTGDEVVAILRGLQALAPNSLYFDGTMVALNASRTNLLTELHATLGDYPDRIAGAYKRAVPPVQDSAS